VARWSSPPFTGSAMSMQLLRWLLPLQSKQKPKSEESNVRSSPSHKSRLAGLKRAEPRALSFGSPRGTKRIMKFCRV
jgi:hypothetical protein